MPSAADNPLENVFLSPLSRPCPPRPVALPDPLWDEIEAFLCRNVRIPERHELCPRSRLRRDLQLRAGEQADLLERYFDYFRVGRGDYDRARERPLRAWPWRRSRRMPDITAGMLLAAVRRGYWSSRPEADGTAPRR